VAHERPTTSDVSQDVSTRAELPEQELAEIIRRAAAIGVPAWRVTTALAVALPAELA